MASIEKMKNALIDHEINYIRSTVLEGKFLPLIEYVVTNKFSDWKDITEEEIKELYEYQKGEE